MAEVEGYRQRFTLVSSKVTLGGLDILSLFCARFRQEDGFRDLKQRLGWEECRAWTKLPIMRTTQALFVVFVALRVVQCAPGGRGGNGLVDAPTLEPTQGAAKRPGPGAAVPSLQW